MKNLHHQDTKNTKFHQEKQFSLVWLGEFSVFWFALA